MFRDSFRQYFDSFRTNKDRGTSDEQGERRQPREGVNSEEEPLGSSPASTTSKESGATIETELGAKPP